MTETNEVLTETVEKPFDLHVSVPKDLVRRADERASALSAFRGVKVTRREIVELALTQYLEPKQAGLEIS